VDCSKRAVQSAIEKADDLRHKMAWQHSRGSGLQRLPWCRVQGEGLRSSSKTRRVSRNPFRLSSTSTVRRCTPRTNEQEEDARQSRAPSTCVGVPSTEELRAMRAAQKLCYDRHFQSGGPRRRRLWTTEEGLAQHRLEPRISPNGHLNSAANRLRKSIARLKTLQSRMCCPTEPISIPDALDSVQ
jgi:hypothetical protein